MSLDSKVHDQLLTMAAVIDSHQDWWRFPAEGPVQGFMGASSVFIVGDQPSTSPWEYSNRNRRVFYDLLPRVGAADAHITDLYKKRGKSGALKKQIPADFMEHVALFRREVELLRPARVIALGHHSYQLLRTHVPEIGPVLHLMWHFAYVVRFNKVGLYETNMRHALDVHKLHGA
jgi:hypothetical protein